MSAKAIHRCRLTWPSGAYIELENSRGLPAAEHLTVIASIFGVTLTGVEESCPVELAACPQPGICLREEGEALFRCFQIREETKYFIDIGVPISFEHAHSLAVQSEGWPLTGSLAKAFERDPPRRWRHQGDLCIVTGSLNFGSYAGIVSFGISGISEVVESEVACRKLNYFSEFKALLDEIAELIAELLLQQESPTAIEFKSSDSEAVSQTGAIVLLRHLMKPDNLPLAINKIVTRPRTRFLSRIASMDSPDAAHLATDSLAEAFGDGDLYRTKLFPSKFRGMAPARFPVEVFEDEVDTPENRYVLHMVRDVRELVYRLEADLRRRKRSFAAEECRTWLDQLDDALAHPTWRQVGEMNAVPGASQILQRADGYRDVFRADLYLRAGLSLDWSRSGSVSEAMQGDIRPVSELYEYWCFLTLRRLLMEMCSFDPKRLGDLLVAKGSGFELNLRRGSKSKTYFAYSAPNGKQLTVVLFYNRIFSRPKDSSKGWDGSYSSDFHPDFSILVRSGGSGTGHWIHFDAKYRATTASISQAFSQSAFFIGEERQEYDQMYALEMRRTHKRDDLFKMHTYRDGILGSRGAFILYPGESLHGKGHVVFLRHPSAFDGITGTIPSIGAFPLTPRGSHEQFLSVQKLLKEAFDAISNLSIYEEERGVPAS